MTATESRSGDAPNQDLIYQLEDRPGPLPATFAAIQHVLASFVGVITPTLIIGGVLGLGDYVPYLVSMALFVSGIGTFIQAKRVGPIGAGMLCLQGTSFGFLSVILAAGFIVKNRGGSPEEILATLIMFGTVAIAGIKILAEAGLNRRNMLIVAISLGLGLGVAAVPEVLTNLPEVLKNIFGSPITIGAFSAILLNFFLPRDADEQDDYDPDNLIEDSLGTNTLAVNIPNYAEPGARATATDLSQQLTPTG